MPRVDPELTAVAAGYAIGSIPVGLLIGRLTRGLDVRDHGSGSTGMTNVLRVVGPSAAALTFALDVGKGAAAVQVARRLGAGPRGQAMAGFAAVVGHCYPALAKFRGGKGVATGFGAILSISPAVSLYPVAGGLAALAASRIVSVGSLTAVTSAVAGAAVQRAKGRDQAAIDFAVAAGLLIAYRHAANVKRLIRGKEPRLSLRRGGRS